MNLAQIFPNEKFEIRSQLNSEEIRKKLEENVGKVEPFTYFNLLKKNFTRRTMKDSKRFQGKIKDNEFKIIKLHSLSLPVYVWAKGRIKGNSIDISIKTFKYARMVFIAFFTVFPLAIASVLYRVFYMMENPPSKTFMIIYLSMFLFVFLFVFIFNLIYLKLEISKTKKSLKNLFSTRRVEDE